MPGNSDDSINNKLVAIENILSSAAALNGGFDKLMVEISCIKNAQEEMKEMISRVGESVYNPETGLLTKAREAENKLASLDKFDDMLNPIIDRHKEMSLWVGSREKELDRWNDKKSELLLEIDRLTQWKNTVTKVLWIMGGSTLGLLAKNLLSLLVI
tara:strand:+ start:149 stop:619 length:471 start_codon:yes stop_codon:yes gene_type:complete